MRVGPLTRIILGGAVLAALCVLIAGPLARLGLDFRSALSLLRWGAMAAGLFALLALVAVIVALMRGRPKLPPFAALVIAAIAFAWPLSLMMTARSVPAIHDITTDTDDPPAFAALVPVRQQTGALNPPEYDPAVAAEQRAAYPDIRPLYLPVPPGEAFRRAEAAARTAGWQIADSDPAEGRIEATATTGWFGFKDDVIIRLQPAEAQTGAGEGTRIDVRSKSRVGRSDLGANAARIRSYLDMLR